MSAPLSTPPTELDELDGYWLEPAQSPYIVSRRYDWLWFLLPPLLALSLGFWVSTSSLAYERIAFWGDEVSWRKVLLGILIHAHLLAVVFRSHANKEVFETFRWRFVLVPLALCTAMNLSLWVMVSCSVLATFWDVYHSGAQTFGFARIYDRKAGNDPTTGRRLDFYLNQLLYAGPILAGVTMMAHVDDFQEFEDVGDVFFLYVPSFMQSNQSYLAWMVVGGGSLFLAYYVLAYRRLVAQGYRVSPLKVFLLATTGGVSIYSWGFNTWGEAFLIMNVFHAVQYLGLVWAHEKKSIIAVFRLTGRAYAKPIALVLFLCVNTLYGYFVQATDSDIRVIWSVTTTVALMHFWYDGFIWSVRRGQF